MRAMLAFYVRKTCIMDWSVTSVRQHMRGSGYAPGRSEHELVLRAIRVRTTADTEQLRCAAVLEPAVGLEAWRFGL